MHFTRLTVAGSGAFPLDMLRFLQAWPARSEDVQAIHRSICRETLAEPVDRIEIRIETDSTPSVHTLERWRSFGWHVIGWVDADDNDRSNLLPMLGLAPKA